MKKFLIQEDKIQLLIKIFEQLALIEVKGDSVIHLYTSRMSIKEVVESIKEEYENKEEK